MDRIGDIQRGVPDIIGPVKDPNKKKTTLVNKSNDSVKNQNVVNNPDKKKTKTAWQPKKFKSKEEILKAALKYKNKQKAKEKIMEKGQAR